MMTILKKKEIRNYLLKNFKYLECLPERRKLILICRYGLEDGKIKTLREAGKVFKITYARIRQIEQQALRKIYRIQNWHDAH